MTRLIFAFERFTGSEGLFDSMIESYIDCCNYLGKFLDDSECLFPLPFLFLFAINHKKKYNTLEIYNNLKTIDYKCLRW